MRRSSLLLNDLVHQRGFILLCVFVDRDDARLDRAGAELQLQHIARLDVVRRAGDLAVHEHAARVARLVRDRAALDDPRNLEIFIQTHVNSCLSARLRV